MTIIELYNCLIKKKHKYKINEFDIRHLISFYQKIDPFLLFYLKSDEKVKCFNKINIVFEKIKKCPLAYLIKETFFLKNKYFVNKNVLIPRQETEELVILAIKKIDDYVKEFRKKKLNILDVGTGSGVIAIEIKKKYPQFKIYGSDISKKALKVAKINSKRLKTDVSFFQADVFPKKNIKYNIIISNPPYIKNKKNVAKSVLNFEPHKALFITKKNNVYEKILKNIIFLTFPSLLIFEISEEIVLLLSNLLFLHLKKYKYNYSYEFDINNKIRFLILKIYNKKQ